MITSDLASAGEQKPQLSEESEEEILRMVEEQLDRPNPPDTKVLYRRAMHFVDRDVRHLTLQQFNAKFPLQVKRKLSAEEQAGSEAGNGACEDVKKNGRAERPTDSARNDGHDLVAKASDGSESLQREADPSDGGGTTESAPAVRDESRRARIRSALLEYAKLVAGAETRAELVEAILQVDEYVAKAVGEEEP